MVYIFLAEGFEAIETITPLDMLIRAGIEVNTISISDEFLVKSSQGIPVQADENGGQNYACIKTQREIRFTRNL